MNRNKKTIAIAALALVILTLVASACAQSPTAPPPTTVPGAPVAAPTPKAAAKLERVKVGTPSLAGVSRAFFLGKEKGIFKEEGIDVEVIELKASLLLAAMTAGELDFAASLSNIFESALMGAPYKGLASIMRKTQWHIIGAPGVNSPEDLRGKAVAVASIGATAYFSTREALASIGLDPDKDVTFVAMAQDAQFVALRAKSVGAASLVVPYTTMAKREGMKDLVFTGDVNEKPSANGLSATDKKLKESPDQAKRVIRGTLKSLAYWRDKSQETIEYLMRELNLDRETASDYREDIVRAASFNGGFSEKGLQLLVEEGRVTGRIKGEVSIKKAIDFSLLREVQKELNLEVQKDIESLVFK
ncbi:MAG: ABC transporter substrate-binding protein [Chloroflexi bacterium]|nr:ABC transporter substrate-binding protein [Chloroflexota bacterium]